MTFVKFLQRIVKDFSSFERKVNDSSFGLSQAELNGILRHAKGENVKFLEKLSKIPCLSAVEIGFLLSSINLDDEKIETIKKAAEIYREEEFTLSGQTFADFIFRVCVNLDMLNCSNIEMFKELSICKNEIYDFANALKTPGKLGRKRQTRIAYAFERVHIEN